MTASTALTSFASLVDATRQHESDLLASVPTGLLIGGQWRDSSDGGTFDVHDPATGEVLATLASATSEDAVSALDAADAAQPFWAATAPRVRSEILRRAFELVTVRADEFALLMTLEMGKPLAEARGEVTYGAEFLRWFAEEAVRDYGRYLTTPEGKNKILVQQKPVGPCLLITPWNFPLAMATRKVAPAVAAGCTMVLKPAKLTPLTAQYFAQTMLDAGLPAGVLNVVASSSASGISGPLMRDSRLRKVSFTGSTPVGKRLLADAAGNVLRTSMELGGNAPFIVFEDADVDKAVEGAMAAKMRNMGEACTAANRFLVHEAVAAEFTRKFAAAMGSLSVGRGTAPTTQVGPLIDAGARADVHALVTAAVDAGATALTGGTPADGPGYFYPPTVLANVPKGAAILRQEIFGPVAPVTTFSTEEEAIRQANSTEYGLAAYLYGRDFNRLLRVAEQIEFGMVGFNAGVISNAAAPFGGVKQSGLGREGGSEGIAEYTTTQYIGIADPYAN
ncbi:NAD-dependent succinate-semialdehyde dehydrogenase [Arthrobacter sp. TES]|uniref:NAD-dependent succinate-semialdehyde dehydrogenase n=1 Tax=Paenarthrobacter ureafaciens TaxID=37931 RepID=UPI000395F562|nr:NAD-dependent succinate-semialdehyde dehydrogenase [Paenarthrobacter ureafaciens]AOY73092.1 aldehyde dehydrogenase [Arthrobacter sp. ZXY-2]ERI38855.1 succinate-semialdehyde dehydrogenase [Arthrobacter sp. AK-YN10]QOI64666.1 NAD-dependent succinate-semialdehyde dehydrogenase [Arthrobacter sp. TES]GLU59780.1 NAD-dependent succinate-semialdehyde dehydrogenase [Paenarthrobacter ureafaciens]GLU63964.1 NAD-dependent succinate-semialdehyde dehydrogenase [Paenarthrobacter ureafaciens]